MIRWHDDLRAPHRSSVAVLGGPNLGRDGFDGQGGHHIIDGKSCCKAGLLLVRVLEEGILHDAVHHFVVSWRLVTITAMVALPDLCWADTCGASNILFRTSVRGTGNIVSVPKKTEGPWSGLPSGSS